MDRVGSGRLFKRLKLVELCFTLGCCVGGNVRVRVPCSLVLGGVGDSSCCGGGAGMTRIPGKLSNVLKLCLLCVGVMRCKAGSWLIEGIFSCSYGG